MSIIKVKLQFFNKYIFLKSLIIIISNAHLENFNNNKN